MNDIMLQLGDFQFVVSKTTYQSLSRSSEFRWEQQNLIGTKPNVQYTGENSETISLSGVFYTAFGGDRNYPDTFRDMARKGVPYMLVGGDGVVHGEWAITKIDIDTADYYSNGIPRKSTFTLSLIFVRD